MAILAVLSETPLVCTRSPSGCVKYMVSIISFLGDTTEIADLMLQALQFHFIFRVVTNQRFYPFSHTLTSNPCPYRFNQSGLPHIFISQGSHDVLVMGAFCYNVVDDHRVFLSLPPKSCIQLLVQFQRPGQSKPDDGAATFLQVQTVAGRGWVYQSQRNFPCIPIVNVL